MPVPFRLTLWPLPCLLLAVLARVGAADAVVFYTEPNFQGEALRVEDGARVEDLATLLFIVTVIAVPFLLKRLGILGRIDGRTVIETLETEMAALHAKMAAADYFRQSGDILARDKTKLDDLQTRLENAFVRWETLEEPA